MKNPKVHAATVSLFAFSLILMAVSCNNKANINPMPYYGQFKPIPANAITPKGWLKQYFLISGMGLPVI